MITTTGGKTEKHGNREGHRVSRKWRLYRLVRLPGKWEKGFKRGRTAASKKKDNRKEKGIKVQIRGRGKVGSPTRKTVLELKKLGKTGDMN